MQSTETPNYWNRFKRIIKNNWIPFVAGIGAGVGATLLYQSFDDEDAEDNVDTDIHVQDGHDIHFHSAGHHQDIRIV